jgi:alkaline phosphatase
MIQGPKRTAAAAIAIALFCSGTIPAAPQAGVVRFDRLTPRELRNLRTKNVVLMIPDGMGVAHATLGRWYKYAKTGVNALAFDDLACGLVRTYWSTGLITESAAAASAMATGFKTSARNISLTPERSGMPGVPDLAPGTASTPLATVLEGARMSGLSTGLVVTSEFCHATPAGFASHYIQRAGMNHLAEQEVYQAIDVVLGGGWKYLDPAQRKDKEDLVEVLRERGYTYVTDGEALAAASGDKLWGVFAEGGIGREIDREAVKAPSLDEMTRKALGVLSRNRRGFFLMVEGSQIDWAAHANDGLATAAEVFAFDRAVQVVLDFARADGDTAVIIASDHTTGGLTIGNQATSDMSMDRFVRSVDTVKSSATRVAELLTTGEPLSTERSRSLIADLLGLSELNAAETREFETLLKSRIAKPIETFLARAASRRAGLGWVSTNHGGDDIPLYILHPRDLRIGGVVQNTEIAVYISKLLGFNLANMTARLFVPAASGFASVGATLDVDASDPENPVLVASKGDKRLRIPAFKSVADLDGRAIELGGIVVTTGVVGGAQPPPPGTWFLPRTAVDLLK